MGLTTETTLWFNTNLVNVGASVMSGKNTGVQARVKFYAPLAFYVCFNAYCLSLVLVHSVKCIPEADCFFFFFPIALCFCFWYQKWPEVQRENI